MNVKRRLLSHSKSLSRGKKLVVGTIDKEIMGKESATEK